FCVQRRSHQQGGARLSPSGQIVEVIVWAIAIYIIRALSFGRRKHQSDAAFELGREFFAPCVIVGGGLTIQSVGGQIEVNRAQDNNQEKFSHCLGRTHFPVKDFAA